MKTEFITEAKGVTSENQTYVGPLADRVMGELDKLMRFVGSQETAPDLSDDPKRAEVQKREYGQNLCRDMVLLTDLYDARHKGSFVFSSRDGGFFEAARDAYLGALMRRLERVRESLETGERFRPVFPLEIATLCQGAIRDVLRGQKRTVVFDSGLVYGEPCQADPITRAERRYHGVRHELREPDYE